MAINATTVRTEEDRRKRRKGLIGLAAMATAGALVLGLGYAYFSDAVEGSGTASAGTLDISGDVTASYPATSSAENINPGDAFTLTGDIQADGSKSAWVRSSFDFTGTEDAIKPYIYIYEGTVDQADLLAAPDLTAVTGYLGKADAIVNSDVAVLNGTVESETEGAAAYTPTFTVFFDEEAGNAAMGQEVNWTYTVEAVQYRNNAEEPTDAEFDAAIVGHFDSAVDAWAEGEPVAP